MLPSVPEELAPSKDGDDLKLLPNEAGDNQKLRWSNLVDNSEVRTYPPTPPGSWTEWLIVFPRNKIWARWFVKTRGAEFVPLCNAEDLEDDPRCIANSQRAERKDIVELIREASDWRDIIHIKRTYTDCFCWGVLPTTISATHKRWIRTWKLSSRYLGRPLKVFLSPPPPPPAPQQHQTSRADSKFTIDLAWLTSLLDHLSGDPLLRDREWDPILLFLLCPNLRRWKRIEYVPIPLIFVLAAACAHVNMIRN